MNRFDRERWDTMGKEALSRVEELMNTSRINDLIHKREEDEKKKNCILWVLAIIGAVAAVAGIAYAVYRFFTPDYLEDFEDDFDDDFDDDFFDDDSFIFWRSSAVTISVVIEPISTLFHTLAFTLIL